LEVLNLDLPIWSYEIYKTTLKLEFLNYLMNTQPLTCGTRVSADPTRQRDENRGGACDGAATVELANGDSFGDGSGTNTFTSNSRVYRPTWLGLLPTTKTVAAAMAVRWFGPMARHRRRPK